MTMLDLFTAEVNLSIAEVNVIDVIQENDKYKALQELLFSHGDMYPKIDKWLKEKVLPGLKNGTRTAYIGFDDEKPIALSILKVGTHSKFCHLHIVPEYQHHHIGELFFIMMTIDARRKATTIHFTLPESLWESKKTFFKSFSFDEIEIAKHQYRNGEKELYCTSNYSQVWQKSIEKLPGIIEKYSKTNGSIFNGLVMSIKPTYANQIFKGEKQIEIRRRFSTKHVGCSVLLYSTAPESRYYGFFKIANVIKDTPDRLWQRYNEELGCTKSEFDEYSKNCDQLFAIKIGELQPFTSPILHTQLSHLMHEQLHIPQSYSEISKSQNWMQAVSITELLHGKFQTSKTLV